MIIKDLKFFTIIFVILVNMMSIFVIRNEIILEIQNLKNEITTYSSRCLIDPIDLEIDVEFTWWDDYDLELLARTIYYEAGSNNILDEHQQYVGAVVINRLNMFERYKNIYDVITDTLHGVQYSTSNNIISDDQPEIPQRCYDNALLVLNGKVDAPYDLIYQANFVQGKEIWKTFETGNRTTYFCRG